LKYIFKNFITRYLSAWLTEAVKKPGGDFWNENWRNIIGLFDSIDWKRILSQLSSDEPSDVVLAVSGTRFHLKRFGNILGFDIINNNDSAKEHKTGTRAIEALCRTKDPRNNQGIYELIHQVAFYLSIPGKRIENETYDIDFLEFFDLLKNFPLVELELEPHELVDAYWQNDHKGQAIGHFLGLNIFVELVHGKKPDKPSKQDERIWRRGNAQNIGTLHRFAKGDDLQLKIALESSLPESFLGKTDQDFDYLGEQFRIAEVFAIIFAQLRALQLHRNCEVHDQLNK
jgi:hypothetical protein